MVGFTEDIPIDNQTRAGEMEMRGEFESERSRDIKTIRGAAAARFA